MDSMLSEEQIKQNIKDSEEEQKKKAEYKEVHDYYGDLIASLKDYKESHETDVDILDVDMADSDFGKKGNMHLFFSMTNEELLEAFKPKANAKKMDSRVRKKM